MSREECRPGGKVLIDKVPFLKQRWRLSEADIYKISRLLGPKWWEQFARKIGFNDEVEDIKSKYPDFDSQRYQLILQWSNKNESKATYRIILKALSKLDQIDALDEVCKLLHCQSEPGRPLPSALERYSDTLKRRYSEYKLRAIVDWPPPPAETVVKLAMIGDPKIDQKFIGDMTQGKVQNVLKTKTVIEPDKLHKMIESGEGKVFLLEGAPGSGKTTMCWYICKQWGEGKLFKNLSHIIMVELRDKKIQAARCLADILPYCEAEEDRISEQLEKKKGENVLVILEGWNELPKHLRKESIFTELVEKGGRSKLQHAVILVSSRSYTTVKLQKRATKHVEILGFVPNQIEMYVKGCFKEEPHKAQELWEIIQRSPRLQENCYLPLLLIIIVHLYKYRKSRAMPESFCAIIIELALSCLYRHYIRKGIFDDEDVDPLPSFDAINSEMPHIRSELRQLCKQAYNATLKGEYSFSNPTDGLGLLQSMLSIAARGSEVTQYFLHSSLQELCAALYVSWQPIPEQREMLNQLFETPHDYVLRFYSALTHWVNEGVREILLEHSTAIQQEMEKLVLIPPLPEPLSQHLLMIPNELLRFPTRLLHTLKYSLETVLHDKPFNRDELIPHLKMGGSELDPFALDQAEFMEEMMMQLADESFDPNTYKGIDEKKFKKIILKAMKKLATKKGLDPSATSGFIKAMYEQTKTLLLKILPNIETFVQELVESFGTTEIPREVMFEQMMQTFLPEMAKHNPIPQDPRQQLGLPLSSQQQVIHHTHSLIQDGMQIVGTEPQFPDFMKSVLSQMLELKTNPDPQAVTKMFWQMIQNNPTLSMSGHLVATRMAHGKVTETTLMLLHCIYEAGNPLLAPSLGSSLALAGNLNGSDLLALQNVLQMKKDGIFTCDIKTLHLTTTILSQTHVQTLTKALRAGVMIKELTIDVGLYDKELVAQVLSKSTIKRFKYSWADKGVCIDSFCNFLQNNKSLQMLDLSGMPILDIGAIELGNVLNTTYLVELNLSRCGIKEEGIIKLTEALKTNNHLMALHLHETAVSKSALQSLCRCLELNNTLKVIGMVEDPASSELKEKDLQKFVTQLCFNSSITWFMLNSKYRHTPSLQQALTHVNITRKLKQQSLLSIDDHFPKNYSPELCNEFGMRPWEIRMKLSINCTAETMSKTCYLMEELPAQEWTKTLHFTLNFIAQTKAIGNMSMRHVLKPRSKAVCINMQSKTDKPRGEALIEIEAQRILFPKKQLPLQEHQQTLCGSLQFITRFKAVHAMCISTLLPRKTAKGKDSAKINTHLPNPSSQYPAVVEALQKQRPFSQWQQTLFCTQQFIHQSKAVRNMCMNKILGASKKIYIRFRIQQHCMKECSITNSIMCRENKINVQQEFEDHVHNAECMVILLSVITTMADVDTRPLQYCPPTAPEIFLCKDHIKRFIAQNSYCTDCKSLLHGTAFSIVLPYVLHYISTLLS